MPKIQQQSGGLARACFRSLTAACLALSVAILWGETRRQSVQDVMHGLPVIAGLGCSGVLLIASLVLRRRLGRVTLVGLAVSIWTAFVCLLPTI